MLLKRQTGLESFIAPIIYYGINPLRVCTRSARWRKPASYRNQIERYKLRIPNGVLSRLQKVKHMDCVIVSEWLHLSHKVNPHLSPKKQGYFSYQSANNLERKNIFLWKYKSKLFCFKIKISSKWALVFLLFWFLTIRILKNIFGYLILKYDSYMS